MIIHFSSAKMKLQSKQWRLWAIKKGLKILKNPIFLRILPDFRRLKTSLRKKIKSWWKWRRNRDKNTKKRKMRPKRSIELLDTETNPIRFKMRLFIH